MIFDLNIDKIKRIYFMGVGGVSMSSIALLLKSKGFKVAGSDKLKSKMVEDLMEKGIPVDIGQKASNINPDDIIVYTHAITPDNDEYIQAKEYNLPMYSRAEFLGFIMKNYKFSMGVSGTHGKTTTTSMLSHILLNGEKDPTIFSGGRLDVIDGNLRIGESDYFLTEACEYKESFLNFFPYLGIILNIDEDHLDYYRDINHIEEAFIKYAKSIPAHGHLIMNADDVRCSVILEACDCNTITFGLKSGDVTASDVSYDENGFGSFDAIFKGENLGLVKLSTPGEHNIYNALSAIAAGLILDISFADISTGLLEFKGTHRRFEVLGHKNNCKIIAEYAHHPTEIITALKTGLKITKNKLICVFQPHTYTRTIGLLDEFSRCFSSADEVIVADIYAAREPDTGVINSEMLTEKIKNFHSNVKYIGSLDEITSYVTPKISHGDVLMLVGAGDVISIWSKMEKL